MTIAAPPVVPRSDRDDFRSAFSALRELNVDVQDLRRSVRQITQAISSGSDAERIHEVLTAEKATLDRNQEEIDQRRNEIRGILTSSPDVRDVAGDGVARIDDLWARTLRDWPKLPDRAQDPDVPAVLQSMTTVDGLLRRIAVETCYVTIPTRVADWVTGQRVTGRFNFHKVFADELPEEDDRKEIMEYIARSPALFEGILDLTTGDVYRFGNRSQRLQSYAAFGAVVLLGAGFQVLASLIVRSGGLTAVGAMEDAVAAVVAYGWVLLGGLLHLGVDVLKARRTAEAGQTMTDYLIWLHVRQTSIILGLITLWLGPLAVAALSSSLAPFTALLAGYSIDSVIDTLLGRFEKSMNTATEKLVKDAEGRIPTG